MDAPGTSPRSSMSAGAPGPPGLQLATPIESLGSFAKKFAGPLRALGVANLGQLLAYLPMRYEFQEAETNIGGLEPDRVITARGEVTATRTLARGGRPRFEAVLMDETGRLDLVWFNQTYLRHQIHPGMRLRVHGQARKRGPGIQVANPRFEILDDAGPAPDGGSGGGEPEAAESRIRPVYPASEAVTSRQIEAVLRPVLVDALKLIVDHLPEAFRKERELPALADAYRMLHVPETDEETRQGRRRLAYDELLLLQLGVQMKRLHLRETLRSPALKANEAIDRHIRERFPFVLTPAQDRVIAEIAKDLKREVPTNRLIQGDVGSGKTIVALYAMLLAAASGHQGAIMAPTEILAEQHYSSISRMLEGSKVRIELLTGTVAGAERASINRRVEAGEVDILIGTQALLTETVRFHSLAVAIIDEQHRFGVFQRAGLRTKGGAVGVATPPGGAGGGGGAGLRPASEQPEGPIQRTGTFASGQEARPTGDLTPHVLVMTATPIPRTLGLTLLGDLDISTIDQLPPGRTPIATRVVGPDKANDVYQFVRTRIEQGDQAYIVVPTIESGDRPAAAPGDEASGPEPERGMKDVRSLVKQLEEHDLAGKRVAALHGRLKRETREQIMGRFRAGLIDALVATTVIEVGVDVPNATVMVIEHAERFGLAQLHQLRGRVGRGSKPSVCVLIGEATTEDAAARLKAMADTADGFVLAEKDLEIRGPGEVFGIKQSGAPPFKVADLQKDLALLRMAKKDATAWIARSPALAHEAEALLRRRLFKAHGKWLGLGDVG